MMKLIQFIFVMYKGKNPRNPSDLSHVAYDICHMAYSTIDTNTHNKSAHHIYLPNVPAKKHLASL